MAEHLDTGRQALGGRICVVEVDADTWLSRIGGVRPLAVPTTAVDPDEEEEDDDLDEEDDEDDVEGLDEEEDDDDLADDEDEDAPKD